MKRLLLLVVGAVAVLLPVARAEAAPARAVAVASQPGGDGWWVAFADGAVHSGGGAPFHGSMAGRSLARPIVGMAATPGGGGYWLVASDGGIFAFGDAMFRGSTGAIRLNQPIVGMASTPSGRGYWLVARDGGIFTFGDAVFRGSTGAIRLNRPIVGMASTPSGRGYWLVASDGGIFAFGDAVFRGSTGALRLNSPIVGMAATSSGRGYWLAAADGGIFTFGDAAFAGAGVGGEAVGLAPATGGYRVVMTSGGVVSFPRSAGECTIFPADNPWNQDVSGLPVHPRSAAWIASIGSQGLHPDFGTVWDGAPNGIPFVEVGAGQPRVPVSFDYADESDPGPYPIPPDAPIEGGRDATGDRHVLVLDRSECRLWELFDAHPVDGGASWRAGSGATWDLRSNALRPEGWTSADAAGLPIYPGLVKYDEVASGAITHALRFTASRTQRAYIHPATHVASSITDPNVPPMGARVRLRASFDCSGLSAEVQVVCAAMKRYGMLLADNGSSWYVSGAPDPRWSDDRLADLRRIPGSAFEVVDTGPVRN